MSDFELMSLDEYRSAVADAARRDEPEHREQAALFAWASDNVGRWPELALLFAIPNGGLRHIFTAKKLKAEGVRAGVPDVFLPVARGVHHGLFIEMKAAGGRVRPVQRVWIGALQAHGYAVVVAYSAAEAEREIEKYLSLPGVGEVEGDNESSIRA